MDPKGQECSDEHPRTVDSVAPFRRDLEGSAGWGEEEGCWNTALRRGSGGGCAGRGGCAVRAAVRGAGRRGRAAGMIAPLLGSAGSGWLLLGEWSPDPPRQRGFVLLPAPLAGSRLLSPQRVGTRSPPWHGDTGPNPPKRPLGPRSGSPWPPLLRDKGYSKLFTGNGRRERHSAWGWDDTRRDACSGEPAP